MPIGDTVSCLDDDQSTGNRSQCPRQIRCKDETLGCATAQGSSAVASPPWRSTRGTLRAGSITRPNQFRSHGLSPQSPGPKSLLGARLQGLVLAVNLDSKPEACFRFGGGP
ncbi:hypothetical protein OG21DRAFT_799633 [Imleria badia]|nr:hypothetical protein OG21DRAFT_799633 [Imleria badia]